MGDDNTFRELSPFFVVMVFLGSLGVGIGLLQKTPEQIAAEKRQEEIRRDYTAKGYAYLCVQSIIERVTRFTGKNPYTTDERRCVRMEWVCTKEDCPLPTPPQSK